MTDDPRQTVYLFDLDGTLTAVELLPLIAQDIGLAEEMAELTRATMAGELPFDASFRYRVDLLGGLPTSRVADIIESAPVMEELLDWIGDHRSQCWIVTGNLDCWVKPWMDRHGLRGFTSESRLEGGRVRVGKILRKESVVARFTGHRTVMVGDGANDAQALDQASVGIASAIVHPVPQVTLEVADFAVMTEGTLCKTLSRL